jgi:hypothetical protein
MWYLGFCSSETTTQTKGNTMRIFHNNVICGHADYTHPNKHVCRVSDEDGEESFVATAWDYTTLSTGVRRKLFQVETHDSVLLLDEDGLACLLSTLKRLSECEIELSTCD